MGRLLLLEIEGSEDYRKYLPLLSSDRVASINGLRNDEDKVRSVCGELLARKLISDAYGLSNHEIEFACAAGGKPFWRGRPDFFFNISHSGDWVAVISGKDETGVDVEKTASGVEAELPPLVLSQEELMLYRALQRDAAIAYFYRLWTLKESLLKAKGCGLSLNPARITLRIAADGKTEALIDGVRQKASFREYRLLKGYCLAACSLGNGDLPQKPEFVKMEELGI